MSDAATTTAATTTPQMSREVSSGPGRRGPSAGGPPAFDAPHHSAGRRATVASTDFARLLQGVSEPRCASSITMSPNHG